MNKTLLIGFSSLLALALVGAGCQSTTKTPPTGSSPTSTTSDASCPTVTDLTRALRTPETVCSLDVSNQNRTGALPAEIRRLTNLKALDASKNNMTGIPAEIGQLQNLSSLNYSFNKLDTMPDEIANLKNLKVLSLAHNNYKQPPSSVLKLTQLQILDLTGNPISSDEIGRIKELLPRTVVRF
jgi:Leucine-rich repeat (LRR) protein